LRFLGLGVWLAGVAACGGPDDPARRSEGARPEGAPAVAAPAPVRERRPQIVILGDSLTAGLGLDQQFSYPALIQKRLDGLGLSYEVVNAGVSGDTSAGGLRRIDWALEGTPKVLVVALGGNDGLRGIPPADLRRNLAAMIERGQARGAAVILAGMEAPPNNGPEYTAAFRAVYVDLAREYRVPLIPFLLDGVAGDPSMNQADGIHPNRTGAARLAETVWAALEPIVAGPPAGGR
jgi:acyl-CoA thioesterase-1